MSTLAELMIKVGVDPARAEKGFKKLAPMAKVAGAAAGAAVVVGAVEGMEREALGDKLAAQLDLSGAESAQAGKIAGALYADAYGESMEQVNDAVGQVVKTLEVDLGDSDAVEGLTAKALDLVSAFDTDLNTAVGNAGVLMRTGLAKDADHAFDLITAGMQEIPPALRDELGEATKEYSKFFADLGFTGEETFGLLASADDQFSLDKTGDAIKELSIRATDMSTASVESFEAMGLDADQMAGKILAGGDTARQGFDQIVDGLLAMEDPTARANAAIGLFGTPLEDLGTSKIPEFLASLDEMGGGLGDVTGRAEAMGETLNDNAKTKITAWTRKFEGMLAKVVEAPGILGDAASAVAGVGAVLQPIGPALAGVGLMFREQLSAAASKAASVAGKGMSAVGKGAGKLAAAVGKGVGRAAMAFASLAARAAAATARVVAQIAVQVARWAFMGAQALVHAAKVAAAWLIAMGPIGALVAAVVAAVVVIVKNWDKIAEFAGKAFGALVDFLKKLPGRILSAISALAGRVKDFVFKWHPLAILARFIASKWGAIKSWFGRLPGRVASAIAAFGTSVAKFIVKWHPLAVIWRKAIEFLPRVVGFYRSLPGRILKAVGQLGGLLRERGKQVLRGMVDGAVSIVRWFAGRWATLPGTILRAVGNLGRLLWDAGRDVMRGLLDGARSMKGSVVGFFNDLGNLISNPVKFALGIGSPSKVFMGFGEAITEGLLLGVDERAVSRKFGRLGGLASVSASVGVSGPGRVPGLSGGISGGAAAGGAVLDNRPIILQVDGKTIAEVTRREFVRVGRRNNGTGL